MSHLQDAEGATWRDSLWDRQGYEAAAFAAKFDASLQGGIAGELHDLGKAEEPLMMQPILRMLDELTHPDRPYGCSMVVSTATQPALEKSEGLPCGLANVRPIVPSESVGRHFKALEKRHPLFLSRATGGAD